MGMRMKVAVGYGLDLTGLDKSRMNDNDFMENEGRFKAFVDEALASAKEREDFQDQMCINFALHPAEDEQREIPKAFYQTLEHDEEFAFADKLLLYPLGYKEQWSRYGDDLDAFIYESEWEKGEFEPLTCWREKPGTLYPFSGKLMRANPEMPFGIETYWIPCYMDQPRHRDAIPAAPVHLWFLIKHLGLTHTDEETTQTFLNLRPTFMRWWS